MLYNYICYITNYIALVYNTHAYKNWQNKINYAAKILSDL